MTMWMGKTEMANHLLILPIVLPLLSGALLILLEKAQSRWVPGVALASMLALVWVAVKLLLLADQGGVHVYLLGNWQAPWGIALALDRLSALMLLLTALVGLASLGYALGGDDRKGLHFHALLQFQLMGLNGAFLTADLFNLFVFFEVLLAASYGLLLHGASIERLKASVHYVVFNLTGSALFLLATSLLYALTGTLNMADLAFKLGQLGPENLLLAKAGVLLLVVVFAVKAALLPLYFWLPATYASASAPVAALFAIMTKVGVYAIARVSTLWAGSEAMAGLLSTLLPLFALGTVVLAAIGVLAAKQLRTLVAYLVVVSAGTLLLAVGLGSADSLAAGLFYLINSTLIACLWFLLADRISAARGGEDCLSPRPIQSNWGVLGGLFFVASIAIAGVPPLAGFLGKALLLQAAGHTTLSAWVASLVLTSSLLIMVALARAGTQIFWVSGSASAPALKPGPSSAFHAGALSGLLALVLACAVFAGPLYRYAQATAQQLMQSQSYIEAVLGAQQVPAAHDVRKEMRERGDLK